MLMQITYYGQSCFRIKSGEASLLIDPFDPKFVGLTFFPKTTADIVLVSHEHSDHNDLSRLKNQDFFLINAPGEYEVKGISVVGLPSFHDKQKTIPNIIYIIEAEGIRVCHLGDLGHLLDNKQLDQIDGIDVLLIKAGDKKNSLLTLGETIKLINQIEPAYVIPMHYQDSQMNLEKWQNLIKLEDFLKEYGSEGEKVDKLLVNKANLPEDTKLIILEK